MISSFNKDIFDVEGQMNAIALNTINAAQEDSELLVYIPKMLPFIEKGEPEVKILQTKGISVFKNANNKPALTDVLLHEKNYFKTTLNATSNIDDLKNNSTNLITEMNQTIKEFAYVNNLQSVERYKKLNYLIQENTILRVEFLNNKLNRLAFTTLDRTKTQKNFE